MSGLVNPLACKAKLPMLGVICARTRREALFGLKELQQVRYPLPPPAKLAMDVLCVIVCLYMSLLRHVHMTLCE